MGFPFRKQEPDSTPNTPNGVGWLLRHPLTKLVDQAATKQQPLVLAYVAAVRKKSPDATPAQIIDILTKQYVTTVIGTGAAIGGAAALPTIGTITALTLSAGEVVAFVEATALYSLAVAHVHGVELHDPGRRRALLMAVLIGDSGTQLMRKVTGKGDTAWGQLLPSQMPKTTIDQVNRMMGRWAMRRFAVRKGAAVMGRLVPFGIGAVIGGSANAAIGRSVVDAVKDAFGTPPESFPVAQIVAGPSA